MAVYHGETKYDSVAEAFRALGPVYVRERDGKVYVQPLGQPFVQPLAKVASRPKRYY